MESRIAWGNRSLHIRVLYGEKARDNDRYHVLFPDALHDIALFRRAQHRLAAYRQRVQPSAATYLDYSSTALAYGIALTGAGRV